MWTSSVLLATLVVSALSFPHHDGGYEIPRVGRGDRSQYYVLHRDGTFKYGFDSGDGAFESVKSHTLGNRDGEFGYVDPEGNSIKLEYEAGEGGFVARGDHLPKASPELAQAIAAVLRRTDQPFVDPLAGGDGDRSYGFNFASESHSRNEQADEDGTITGSYSYVDEDGVLKNFNYRAGKGIGFVITGDGLTEDVQSSGPTSRITANTRVRTSHPSTSFNNNNRATTRRAQGNVVSTRSGNSRDASYSFNYDAGDHSRSETSDKNLNVQGQFSFIGDDGQNRVLNYKAGSGSGFQAEGSHLPVAPVAEFGNRLSSSNKRTESSSQINNRASFQNKQSQASLAPPRKAFVTRSHTVSKPHASRASAAGFRSSTGSIHAQSGSGQFSHQNTGSNIFRGTGSSGTRATTFNHQAAGNQFSASSGRPRNFEEAAIRSSSTPGGGYSFSYDTSSHSRSETGDSANNVDGKFDFIADDDQERREINYEAGSDTGFIARGDHIPVGPEVPGASSGQPTGDLEDVEEFEFKDPLAGSDIDQSYHFNFDSDSYSRSETVDEDGYRVGTYTVTDDDGLRIVYRYRAGKGIGYEVEEVSRVQGPRPVRPTPYSGPLAIEEAAPFDVPGTPNFPTPGQSNYVHPNPTNRASSAFGTQRNRVRVSGQGSSTNFNQASIRNTQQPSGASIRRGTAQSQRGATTNFFTKHSGSTSGTANNANIFTKHSGHTHRGSTSGSANNPNIFTKHSGGAHRGSISGTVSNTNKNAGSSAATNAGFFTSFKTGANSGASNIRQGANSANIRQGSHAVNTGTATNVRQGSRTVITNQGSLSSIQQPSRDYSAVFASDRQTSHSNRNAGHRNPAPSIKSQFNFQRSGFQSTRNQVANNQGSNVNAPSHLKSNKVNLRNSFTPSHSQQSFTPSHSQQVFDGFTLHKYAATPDAMKFGYVLKFD